MLKELSNTLKENHPPLGFKLSTEYTDTNEIATITFYHIDAPPLHNMTVPSNVRLNIWIF